jgi:hypothetical protein
MKHQQTEDADFFGTLTNEKTTTWTGACTIGSYYPKEVKESNLEPCGRSGSHRESDFASRKNKGSTVGRVG